MGGYHIFVMLMLAVGCSAVCEIPRKASEGDPIPCKDKRKTQQALLAKNKNNADFWLPTCSSYESSYEQIQRRYKSKDQFCVDSYTGCDLGWKGATQPAENKPNETIFCRCFRDKWMYYRSTEADKSGWTKPGKCDPKTGAYPAPQFYRGDAHTMPFCSGTRGEAAKNAQKLPVPTNAKDCANLKYCPYGVDKC